jgi:transposase InsO family protein
LHFKVEMILSPQRGGSRTFETDPGGPETPRGPSPSPASTATTGSQGRVAEYGEIFYSLKGAQVLIDRWRLEYNTFSPHRSLGYRPPSPEAWLIEKCKTAELQL